MFALCEKGLRKQKVRKMGFYKYVAKSWNKPSEALDEIWTKRIIEWRTQDAIVRVEHPTRIDRARSLGYKSKSGFVIARVRVPKGGRHKPSWSGGRKPRSMGRFGTAKKSDQWIAEERAGRRYVNMEILNSYYVGADGKHKWFEVILVDPAHGAILKDKHVLWIATGANRGRVFRGLTSAGKKSRGMRSVGKGAEKVRPSQNRHYG